MRKALFTQEAKQPVCKGFSNASRHVEVVLIGFYMTDFTRQLAEYFYETFGQVPLCDNHIGVVGSALFNAEMMDVSDDALQATI
jgi:hypothetical protein